MKAFQFTPAVRGRTASATNVGAGTGAFKSPAQRTMLEADIRPKASLPLLPFIS